MNRGTLEKSHLTMGLHLFTEKVFKGKLTKFWSMVYKNRVIRETFVIYSYISVSNFDMRETCPYSEFSWNVLKRTRKTPNTGTFYAVIHMPVFSSKSCFPLPSTVSRQFYLMYLVFLATFRSVM